MDAHIVGVFAKTAGIFAGGAATWLGIAKLLGRLDIPITFNIGKKKVAPVSDGSNGNGNGKITVEKVLQLLADHRCGGHQAFVESLAECVSAAREAAILSARIERTMNYGFAKMDKSFETGWERHRLADAAIGDIRGDIKAINAVLHKG